MLGPEEIKELYWDYEKFFQRPERKKENAWQIFVNVIPFIVLFFVGFTVTSFLSYSLEEYPLIIIGYLIVIIVVTAVFLPLAIPLRLFGHSLFRTYQAFMYGLVPFLLLGWLFWFSIVVSFFCIFWGLIIVHKIGRAKALAFLILPVLVLLAFVFWEQILTATDILVAKGIAMSLGFRPIAGFGGAATENITYANDVYGFSIDLPSDTMMLQNESDFIFVWGLNAEEEPVVFLSIMTINVHTDLDSYASAIMQACEERPGCTPLSSIRTRFAGYDSVEIVLKMTGGSTEIGKMHVFYVDNGKVFNIMCSLDEDDYQTGISECEEVASTFRYMG